MQEKICKRYNVFLTDHKTKGERLRGILSPKNINKNIDKFQNGITKFTKALDKLDGSKIKIFEGVSQKEYDSLVGKSQKKDYSALLGKRYNKVNHSKIMSSGLPLWKVETRAKKKRKAKKRTESATMSFYGEGLKIRSNNKSRVWG